MAQQIVINGETFGDGFGKVNSNFTELYKEAEAMNSYASLYLPAPELLTITSGTPESLTTALVSRANNFEIVGDSLIYTGEQDIVVKVDGAISMTSDTNNIIATISFAKNLIIGNTDELASRIDRKIGTGADVGAVPVAGTFELTTGDSLDFYCDSSISAGVTITKANFTIHTLRVL